MTARHLRALRECGGVEERCRANLRFDRSNDFVKFDAGFHLKTQTRRNSLSIGAEASSECQSVWTFLLLVDPIGVQVHGMIFERWILQVAEFELASHVAH